MSRTETVLIVDDDRSFLARASGLLSGAGFRVLEAPDGEEACKLLNKLNEQIDLVLIDLVLPGLSGFDIIGAVTRRPNRIKIIATSAVFKGSHLEVAKYLGAHAALAKPQREDEFPAGWLDVIKTVLAERSDSSSAG